MFMVAVSTPAFCMTSKGLPASTAPNCFRSPILAKRESSRRFASRTSFSLSVLPTIEASSRRTTVPRSSLRADARAALSPPSSSAAWRFRNRATVIEGIPVSRSSICTSVFWTASPSTDLPSSRKMSATGWSTVLLPAPATPWMATMRLLEPRRSLPAASCPWLRVIPYLSWESACRRCACLGRIDDGRCHPAPCFNGRDNPLLGRNGPRRCDKSPVRPLAAREFALAQQLLHPALDLRHGRRQSEPQGGLVNVGAGKGRFAFGKVAHSRSNSMDSGNLLRRFSGKIARDERIAGAQPQSLGKGLSDAATVLDHVADKPAERWHPADVHGSPAIGPGDNLGGVETDPCRLVAPLLAKRAAILDRLLCRARHEVGGIARGQPLAVHRRQAQQRFRRGGN